MAKDGIIKVIERAINHDDNFKSGKEEDKMKTKGILRMVLGMVFVVVLGMGCESGGGNPGTDIQLVPDIEVIAYIDTDGAWGFGTVQNGYSTTRLVQIRNKGTATLKYYPPEVTPTNLFSAITHPTSSKNCSLLPVYQSLESPLEPGEVCDFLVEFRCPEGTASGTKGGNLQIASNDPDEPTVNLRFSGECLEVATEIIVPPPVVPPPAPAPRSRAGLDFRIRK